MATKKAVEQVESVEEIVETKPVASKKHKDDDQISCVSVTAGLLVMAGRKTGSVYRWIDAGDKVDVEYADVIAEIRARSNYVYKPRFVIEDDIIVGEHKELVTLYERLYSKDDLKQILALPATQMRQVIEQLPDGVKETLKSMAAMAIDTGELDSIQRIKTLDEIFGTQMLAKMAG